MEQRTTLRVPSRGRKSVQINDLSSGIDSERWRQKTGRPMADQFDPYYTWLGIPPSEQPADFYRLLGIKQFEDNREVISNAADQRMAHVRAFQTGPSARDSQRVLNDLSKAAGCLLNPRRKAMYDQHLQSSNRQSGDRRSIAPATRNRQNAICIDAIRQTTPSSARFAAIANAQGDRRRFVAGRNCRWSGGVGLVEPGLESEA